MAWGEVVWGVLAWREMACSETGEGKGLGIGRGGRGDWGGG